MRKKDGSKKVPAIRAECDKPSQHPFFGMWAEREDMRDPAAYVRKVRQPRYTWDDKLGVVRTKR